MKNSSHARKQSLHAGGTGPGDQGGDEGAMAATPADGERSGVGKLRREVQELKQLVGRLAAVNSLETVMINGFSQLTTQLQPLRSLEPTRGKLPRDAAERLRKLREALKRPKWRGSDFSIHQDSEDNDSDHI